MTANIPRTVAINSVTRRHTSGKGQHTIVYDNTGDQDSVLTLVNNIYREKDNLHFSMRDAKFVDDSNVLFIKMSLATAEQMRDRLSAMDLAPRCSKCGKRE